MMLPNTWPKKDVIEIFPPLQPQGENQFWVHRGWNMPGNVLPTYFESGLIFDAFFKCLKGTISLEK